MAGRARSSSSSTSSTRWPIPRAHGGDPLDAFDVIAPSLPGYGFSGPPIREDGSTGPIGPRAIAGLWHRLVHDKLNYRRPYGVQGGDWGAVVSSWLAFDHPVTEEKDEWKSGVLGLHLNMIGLRPGIDLRKTEVQRRRAGLARQGPGRARRQDRLPAHPGDAAADAGRRAHRFAGRPGRLDRREIPGLERLRRRSDQPLLDGPAARQHHGLLADRHRGHGDLALSRRHAAAERALPEGRRVETPTGFAAFPADLAPPPPREWIERSFNLRRHTLMPRGGHFAALEEPELLVEDIRAFFRPLRFGAAND